MWRLEAVVTCKAAGTDIAHLKRPVYDADGYCHTCHYARKRHRRTRNRASTVKRLYGWATGEVLALLRYQRGRCAICLRRVGVVKQGSIDHNHTLERAGVPLRDTVRGILCSTCNRYLGHIGDDPAVGIRMAMYLIDPPAPKVLKTVDKSRQVRTD